VGGCDKGLLWWQGAPLVAHVARRVAPQVTTLLLSCNRNPDRYRAYADRIITDLRPDHQGPLAGIEAASGLIRSDYILLAPCDTPLLPLNLAATLYAALRNEKCATRACYAHDGQRSHYLCALVHRNCLASLTGFLDRGERAVHRWMTHVGAMAMDFSDCPQLFANINELDGRPDAPPEQQKS